MAGIAAELLKGLHHSRPLAVSNDPVIHAVLGTTFLPPDQVYVMVSGLLESL